MRSQSSSDTVCMLSLLSDCSYLNGKGPVLLDFYYEFITHYLEQKCCLAKSHQYAVYIMDYDMSRQRVTGRERFWSQLCTVFVIYTFLILPNLSFSRGHRAVKSWYLRLYYWLFHANENKEVWITIPRNILRSWFVFYFAKACVWFNSGPMAIKLRTKECSIAWDMAIRDTFMLKQTVHLLFNVIYHFLDKTIG